MLIKDQLIKDLQEIVKALGGDFVPGVDIPGDLGHGDFTTNAAMILAKRMKLNPMEVAEEIKNKFQISNFQFLISNKNISIFEKVEVVRPGFVNFWLSKEYLMSELGRLSGESGFGCDSEMKGKRIMVEFAHPNTHKSLHVGHIRTIATGETLARLMDALGVNVIRANYQGDVGMHIAKAFYGLLDIPQFNEQLDKVSGIRERVEFLGKAYAAGSQAYESNSEAKQKIHDYNYLVYAVAQKFQEEKGMMRGKTDYLQFVKSRKDDLDKVYEVWKETRQWSLDYYEVMYRKLGTRFDRYYFESECLQGLEMAREAVKRGVLIESDGAVVFKGGFEGLDTRVFVNSLGLPTYEAKELALAEKEFSEFGEIDKVIHIVGPEQSSFFRVTFKVEELLDEEKYKDKQVHLAYGWVRLKHGKMSSRLGNVVTAEQLLNEVRRGLKTILDKSDFSDDERDIIMEKVAIGAVKYSFLKVSIHQEIAFDIEESISLEGNSGPYLQYTFARTQSVIKKSKIKDQKSKINFQFPISPHKRDFAAATTNFKFQKEEVDLLRLLGRFGEVVRQAGEKFAPNILCNYLFVLAQGFNLFYQKHQILTPIKSGQASKDEVGDFRLALTEGTGKVIKEGLRLLGIEAPERM